MCRVRANQNADIPVSTRPLSGIGVGRMTSNVEIRSRGDEQQPLVVERVDLAHLAAREVQGLRHARGLVASRRAPAGGRRPTSTCAVYASSVEDAVEVDPAGDLGVGATSSRKSSPSSHARIAWRCTSR